MPRLSPSALHGIPPAATDPLITVCIFCIGAAAAFVVLYLLTSDMTPENIEALFLSRYELDVLVTQEPASAYSPYSPRPRSSTSAPPPYVAKFEPELRPSWTASLSPGSRFDKRSL